MLGERGAAVRNISSVTSPRAREDGAEADAGEDEDVVGLPDEVRPAGVAPPGAKGLPVATTARPSVQAITSAGTASELDVGLESGKTSGRRACFAISRMAASVKAPGVPAVPTRMVGLTRAMTSSSP